MKLDLKAPHQKYFAKDGKQVCGVTTLLDSLAKDALYDWYPRVEREGVCAHVLEQAKKSPLTVECVGGFETAILVRDLPKVFNSLPVWEKSGKPKWFGKGESQKAADLGTIAHARIEAWLHGTTLDPSGLDEALYAASLAPLERFQEWWDGEGLTLVASEEQLVHPELGYGGTIDFVASDRTGKLVLGDIKTTKANRDWPYPTVIAQVAAYKELWELVKCGPPWPRDPVARVVVVRVGKTPEDLGQQVWLSPKKLDAGMRLFLAAKDAYEAQREL